jgi:hypothetical protein
VTKLMQQCTSMLRERMGDGGVCAAAPDPHAAVRCAACRQMACARGPACGAAVHEVSARSMPKRDTRQACAKGPSRGGNAAWRQREHK